MNPQLYYVYGMTIVNILTPIVMIVFILNKINKKNKLVNKKNINDNVNDILDDILNDDHDDILYNTKKMIEYSKNIDEISKIEKNTLTKCYTKSLAKFVRQHGLLMFKRYNENFRCEWCKEIADIAFHISSEVNWWLGNQLEQKNHKDSRCAIVIDNLLTGEVFRQHESLHGLCDDAHQLFEITNRLAIIAQELFAERDAFCSTNTYEFELLYKFIEKISSKNEQDFLNNHE